MSLISTSRAPSPAVQQSLLPRQTMRQLLGVAVGVACLLLAMRVTAQESGGSTDKAAGGKSDSLVELGAQASNLESRIRRMKDEAETVNAAIGESKNLQASECAGAPMIALRGAVRLSEGYADAVRAAVEANDSKSATDSLSQLSVMYEKVSTALGEVKQCASGGGSSPDNAVQIEKQEGQAPDVKPEQSLNDLSAQSADTPSASPFFEEKKTP